MNRRAFLQLLGLTGLSAMYQPFMKDEETMETFPELLLKIADGERLSGTERDALRQHALRMDDISNFGKSFQNIDGKIDTKYLNLPFNIIQSTVLPASVASFGVEIPPDYKHLLIFSSGRTTTGGTGIESLLARYNSDSGTNYENQVLYGIGAAAGSQTSAINTYSIIGGLSRDGEAAGMCGSGFVFIPNYKSDLYKSALSLVNPGASANIFVQSNLWKNTGSITSMTITSSAGNLKQGCVISVYGIK